MQKYKKLFTENYSHLTLIPLLKKAVRKYKGSYNGDVAEHLLDQVMIYQGKYPRQELVQIIQEFDPQLKEYQAYDILEDFDI